MSLILAVLLALSSLIVKAGDCPLCLHTVTGASLRSLEGFGKPLSAQRNAIISAPSNAERVDIGGHTKTIDQKLSRFYFFHNIEWNQFRIFKFCRKIGTCVNYITFVEGIVFNFNYPRQLYLSDRLRHYLDITKMVAPVCGGASAVMAYDLRGYQQAFVFDLRKFMTRQLNGNIGAKFATGSFSRFYQGPNKEQCSNSRCPQRSDGKFEVQTAHPIGFGGLINGSPLSAEIGIFIGLRILAIGLIALGYRFTRNELYEARLTGGLIAVIGMFLLAGVVELACYSA